MHRDNLIIWWYLYLYIHFYRKLYIKRRYAKRQKLINYAWRPPARCLWMIILNRVSSLENKIIKHFIYVSLFHKPAIKLSFFPYCYFYIYLPHKMSAETWQWRKSMDIVLFFHKRIHLLELQYTRSKNTHNTSLLHNFIM